MKNFFQPQIALPQDHGAWVFLFSPLLIGLFAGNVFSAASLLVTLAAIAAFLIRQPVTMAVKAYAGRRPRSDLPAARFWMLVYGVIFLLCGLELIHLGYTMLVWLALPATSVFAWHLWLVGKRLERRQVGVEILATGVLALAAPAALWVGKNQYDPLGWALWLLVWFQSAASIVYAYLRLEQRQWQKTPGGRQKLQAGTRALAYSGFNLLLAAILGLGGWVTFFIWIPFLIQLGEALWGTFHPAAGAKPIVIGMRQLVISILFTLVFILIWR